MVFWFIPLAISAAQGLNNAAAERNQYKLDKAARKRFDRANLAFTNADLISGYAALGAHRIQEQRAISQSLDQITRQAGQRISTARVSAAESGVQGNSVDAVLNDFKRIQLENEQSLLDTESYAQEQFTRDAEALRSQAHQHLLQGEMAPLRRPDYFQEFINFAGAGMQAYSDYRSFKDRYPTDNLNGPQHDPNAYGPGY